MIDGPLVIDASVVVEYLTDAGLSAPATRVIDSTVSGATELWAPDLILLETLSALRKLVRLRGIGAEQGRRAALRAAELPILTTGVREQVARLWELRDSMTPYDAAYSALARHLGAPLVTADARLVRSHRQARGKAIALADFP